MSWFNEHGIKLSDTITTGFPPQRVSTEGLIISIRYVGYPFLGNIGIKERGPEWVDCYPLSDISDLVSPGWSKRIKDELERERDDFEHGERGQREPNRDGLHARGQVHDLGAIRGDQS